MFGDVLLQSRDGHGHAVRQFPFLFPRDLAQTHEASHPIALFDELAFEPSMFRTSHDHRRGAAHRAPVENAAAETNT
jgi:hypothetical protein